MYIDRLKEKLARSRKTLAMYERKLALRGLDRFEKDRLEDKAYRALELVIFYEDKLKELSEKLW